MSEDRPAEDQGEGVESAIALSSDALAELVRTRVDIAASSAVASKLRVADVEDWV
jgi:hypothetical protein